MNSAPDHQQLHRIKLLHTAAWTFFVCCIVAIYLAAWLGALGQAFIYIAIVAFEVGVLGFNAWRCPLTAVAAQYTDDRAPNFDIYLPRWIAQYNKEIFGPLYVVGVLFTLYRWSTASA